MVQFNLLPDVKQTFIKARRSKRMVLIVAGLAASVSIVILILLLVAVDVLQKKHLNDVNKDISTYTKQLKDTPQLTQILTIQNQLKSLPALDAGNPVTSRLFTYLGQIVPASINISSLEVNFTQNSMEFVGTTSSLDQVNTFVDTLKFTTYSTQKNPKASTEAFNSVVLTTFSRTLSNTSANASYTIDLSYDPAIFNNAQTVTLTVPANKITTRSETDKPNAALFTAPADTSKTSSP